MRLIPEELRRVRWRFIAGGAAVVALFEMHTMLNQRASIDVMQAGMLLGSAVGGAVLGWVVWWLWATNQVR